VSEFAALHVFEKRLDLTPKALVSTAPLDATARSLSAGVSKPQGLPRALIEPQRDPVQVPL
jgi:hypothetical protein